MCTTHIPKCFEFQENLIKNNSSQEFLVGDKASVADFLYLAFYSSVIANELSEGKDAFKSILANYPVLKSYYEIRYEAQKEYFTSLPAYTH